MFRIFNGRFIGENISFDPPENYSLIVRRSEFPYDGVMFISSDGSLKITVCFERDAVEEEQSLHDFIEENDLYLYGDVFTVKRGARTAWAAYYGFELGGAGAYKEVFNFYKNTNLENQVTVTVELLRWRRTRTGNIYEVMDLPQVKNFFESIAYHGYK